MISQMLNLKKKQDKLNLMVHEAIRTNEILQKLLEAQLQTQNDNKKGEKDESLSKPQP